MATQTSMLKGSNNTDVLSREVPTAIHTALTAFGWVQTSDTGQINLATHVLTVADYMIFRMNDALQATAPIYAKFIFGGNSSSGSIKVQLGTATNGAGTLMGQTTNVVSYGTASYFNASGGTPDGSGNYPWYFSGANNRFCMLGNHLTGNTTRCPSLISIERLRNEDGSQSSDGAILMTHGDSVNFNLFTLPATGIVPLPLNGVLFPMGPTGNSGVLGADVVLFPGEPYNVKRLRAGTNLFVAVSGTIAEGTIITSEIYGETMTFRAVTSHKPIGEQASVTLMRWE
jgi:hypothetical protein